MLADSHCHILDPRLVHKADDIVANLANDGLAFIVEISASPDESRESLEFAKRHDNVYCTVGVHPHYCNEYTDEFELATLALTPQDRKKAVAIGECGLDYHYPNRPSDELQQQIFTRQIMLANAMKMPLVVHTREAFPDTLRILIEHKQFIKHGILFHCFCEDTAAVKQIREHFDAYFSFSCRILNDAFRAVPLDRILIETDSPYLAPKSSKVNIPANVKYVATFLSQALDIPFEEISRITLENTRRFYKIGS